jgi:hypothetical protein
MHTNYKFINTAELFIYDRFLQSSILCDLFYFAAENLQQISNAKIRIYYCRFLWPQQVHIKRQSTVSTVFWNDKYRMIKHKIQY